jgi:hypothetical protein
VTRFALFGLRAILTAVVALSLLLPAAAREVTEAEKSALAATIAAYDGAMRANDMQHIMGTLPPPILEAMAAQFSISVDQLIAAAAMEMRQVMQTVLLVSYGMDSSAVTYAELADGMPYALIPTESVIQIPGTGKIRTRSETLALIDRGTWYLLRVDASQLPLLVQVYPGFAAVEFSSGTMEAVE